MKQVIKIAPSVLSSDFSKLGLELKDLDQTSCEYIHLDVMDGHFVPNLTFGPPIIKAIRPYSNKVFDVHLMMSEPEKYLIAFKEAGADILGIHREIKANVFSLLQQIRNLGMRASITYNPDTSIDDIEDFFPYVDQILIMSVFPGFGGQKFIETSLDRGRMIREKIDRAKVSIDLEIDGGVNLKNISEIKKAGFNVIVSGSTIFEAKDREAIITQLR